MATMGVMATSKSMASSHSVVNFLPDFRICRFIALLRFAPNSGALRFFTDNPYEQG